MEINAEPHEFLDWDKPLREQSPQVRAAVARALGRDVEASPDALIRDWHLEVAPQGKRWVVRDAYGEYGTYATQEAAQNRRYDLAAARVLGGHTGEQVYHKFGFKDPREASRALQQAGIKGIRYLDQGSRNAASITRWSVRHPSGGINEFPSEVAARAFLKRNPGSELVPPPQPTSNYVVFDDQLVKIINREGFSGASLLGPLAAAIAGGTAAAVKGYEALKRKRPPP